MQLIPAIGRAFQAIFAIIVLSISIELARGQETRLESVPPATSYAAFCGAFGTLVALIGVASLFVDSLNGLIMWALDGLSALTMLAAGIAFAVLLRDTDCGNVNTTWDNTLLSGGCENEGKKKGCWWYVVNEGKLKSRCTSAKADSAFMFVSFAMCLGLIAGSFFWRRKRVVSYA